MLGHDGKLLRRYREAAQTAQEFRELERHLRGSTVASNVAIFCDDDSLRSLSFQRGFAGNSPQAAIKRYDNALMRAGVNVDIVNRHASLARYKLVLTPDLPILPDETARKLDTCVKTGESVVLDRFGVAVIPIDQ